MVEVFEPSSLPGTYVIKVETVDGSYLEYNIVFEGATTLPEEQMTGIKLYPNPASGSVYLNGYFPENSIWEILSLNGTKMGEGVLNLGQTIIPIDDTLNGICLIRVNCANQVLFIGKIIVK